MHFFDFADLTFVGEAMYGKKMRKVNVQRCEIFVTLLRSWPLMT